MHVNACMRSTSVPCRVLPELVARVHALASLPTGTRCVGFSPPQVYDPSDDEDRGFGLLGDADHLWKKDTRERQQHQVKRAKRFLDILFNHAPEKVSASMWSAR